MPLPSILDVFRISIGPSSSHTLGALRSGLLFREKVSKYNLDNCRITIELCGSFALTGKGHLTDKAVVCGLNGMDVERDGERFLEIYENIVKKGYVDIYGYKIPFNPEEDIVWNKNLDNLTHPNTVRYRLTKDGNVIDEEEYRSVGGGMLDREKVKIKTESTEETFKDLCNIMDFCKKNEIDFAEFVDYLMEKRYSINRNRLDYKLLKRWTIMKRRIDGGLRKEGILPGILKLQRRAPKMFKEYLENLRSFRMLSEEVTLTSIYAIAVAEENASGALVVTAPTCGSSGVLPAVLCSIQERYHLQDEKILDALKVAGLIGMVVIKNGSIAGAEVGCQGEIGVACSMAAASVCYLMGGSIEQIEFAAEIGLEHHLGLTCDPVAGLVQIPCIERNGTAAVSALNASNLALLSRAEHQVSFDKAVETMMEIGKDMSAKYKETSLGGLAKTIKPAFHT